jgi:hypothetical protein
MTSSFQWQRIVALAQEGKSNREIAEACGCTVEVVKSTISQRRRDGHQIRRGPSGPPMFGKMLPDGMWSAVRAEAERRGLTATELCAHLITTISNNNLYAEILDK